MNVNYFTLYMLAYTYYTYTAWAISNIFVILYSFKLALVIYAIYTRSGVILYFIKTIVYCMQGRESSVTSGYFMSPVIVLYNMKDKNNIKFLKINNERCIERVYWQGAGRE